MPNGQSLNLSFPQRGRAGARTRGRPRRTDLRAVVDAILYLLRTGCQWRLISCDFPPWGTVWGYFRRWRLQGVWARVHRALHRAARVAKGQNPEPAVVIMDSQSVKTTEKGAFAALMATSG
jgi:putative transposase